MPGEQQPPRSKAQPQAQVQPTRHSSQTPQTATIRPTQQVRTSATGVRPATAIASVSPSSATLNPNATEFVPRPADAMDEEPSVPPPLATVTPRQSSEEPVAGSSGAAALPGPSTSAGPRASVAPTLKRPRDDADSEAETAKKAKEDSEVIELDDSSSEDDEEEMPDDEEEEVEDEEGVDEDVTTEGEAEYDEMDKGQGEYPAVPDDDDDEVEDNEEGTLEIDEEGIPQVN